MNRAQSTGGGSGFMVAQLLGSGSNFNTSYNTTSGTDVVIPGVTTTFQLPRTGPVLILATITGRVSAAGGGNFGYAPIYIDGVLQGHANGRLVGLFDVGNGGCTSTSLSGQLPLVIGQHTIDLRVHTDNVLLTYLHYQALLEVFQLGA